MKPTIINSIRRILVFLLFTFFLFSSQAFAKKVELKVAQNVALNVFSEKIGLSKSLISIKETIPVKRNGEIVFLIFNFNPTGYIIISGDDNAVPVLVYGENINFSFENAPPGLLCLLEGYKNEISVIKEKGLMADDATVKKWEYYSSDEYFPLKSYSIRSL